MCILAFVARLEWSVTFYNDSATECARDPDAVADAREGRLRACSLLRAPLSAPHSLCSVLSLFSLSIALSPLARPHTLSPCSPSDLPPPPPFLFTPPHASHLISSHPQTGRRKGFTEQDNLIPWHLQKTFKKDASGHGEVVACGHACAATRTHARTTISTPLHSLLLLDACCCCMGKGSCRPGKRGHSCCSILVYSNGNIRRLRMKMLQEVFCRCYTRAHARSHPPTH